MTFLMIVLIILVLILMVAAIFLVKYNSFITLSNLIAEAWSGIEVQLKRRYDLIPNLLETVKGYSKHEKDVFENVTKMRVAAMSSKSFTDKSASELGLSQALKTLFAVAENYPELKANQNFISFQQELSKIEDQIQLARRYYNGVVRDYNISITVFPGNIIANIFNFKSKPFFETSVDEQKNPQVKF